MQRAYLDFTGDFAQTIGLDWLPRSWQVIGSRPSPAPRVCRLVLANYNLPDGPDMMMRVDISEDDFRRLVTIVLTPLDEIAPVAPARYYLASDDSGHRYAVPVERRHDFDEWLADADAVDPPEWALRIEGGFTFTDPWQR